jgi:radical SAM superfamily enzyme with C-terminal helix-hairpin-helix motif
VQDVLHVVNKGSMKDLLALHGIGKKRAEAIIDNRPFHRVPKRVCCSCVALAMKGTDD